MCEFFCVLSALLFVASNVLGFSYFHMYQSHHDVRESGFFQNMTALDPDFIQHQFQHREDMYFIELASGILNAMAWMVFCIPLIQVAWIQSGQGTRMLGVHAAIAALSLGGSITELIARLMFIGATSTGNWLAKDFNLDKWTMDENGDPTVDDIGWRTLQMISIVTRGFLLWIDAAEWLFLSAIFFLLYLSAVHTEQSMLSRCWARFGLLIALLAFSDFSSEVMRLKSWMTFSFVSVAISWVSRIFFMPIWLLWLGRQLSRIRLDKPMMNTSNREVKNFAQPDDENEESDAIL